MLRPGGSLRGRTLLVGVMVLGFVGVAGPAQAAPNGGSACSPGLVPATVDPIYGHLEKAHLERSPMHQVHDAEQTGDYVAMHKAWLDSVTSPSRDGVSHIGAAMPSMLVSHAQQTPGTVGSLSNPDAFALGQTTWLQTGLQPAQHTVTGDSC
jgi:hypothetical protein